MSRFEHYPVDEMGDDWAAVVSGRLESHRGPQQMRSDIGAEVFLLVMGLMAIPHKA